MTELTELLNDLHVRQNELEHLLDDLCYKIDCIEDEILEEACHT